MCLIPRVIKKSRFGTGRVDLCTAGRRRGRDDAALQHIRSGRESGWLRHREENNGSE